MNTRFLLLTCAVVSTALSSAQVLRPVAAMGIISGTVKGADGSPITSGLVSASRTTNTANSRLRRTSAAGAIAPDGSFQLPPVDTGAYRMCVQVPRTVWINPCEWGSGARTVAVPAGQNLSGISLILDKGALVTVHVADPNQLLSTHEGKTPGAHLLLGVGTDSLAFRMASVVSQDVSGRNYQLLIPFDRRVNISVTSAFFRILDGNGITLTKSGNVIPTIVPSSLQAPTFLLSVTGLTSP
jgi:hypothetical protein